ncbi:MAG TPA: septum site-determining protein MinD, partial [Candidatus Aenigmarchaeota archaeon]|nr:septum site-determining protein MinD [Candidatus Aenigmarchaeota archaeon]
MTKIISVVSGKGGVGKTTLVANLGVALASIGKNVLLIDGNLSGANLGLHLDILPFYP